MAADGRVDDCYLLADFLGPGLARIEFVTFTGIDRTSERQDVPRLWVG